MERKIQSQNCQKIYEVGKVYKAFLYDLLCPLFNK